MPCRKGRTTERFISSPQYRYVLFAPSRYCRILLFLVMTFYLLPLHEDTSRALKMVNDWSLLPILRYLHH